MSNKNTTTQNISARSFSRNVLPDPQTGTRRTVKSTPTREVAKISAQRIQRLLQNDPPPFSQLPATQDEAPLLAIDRDLDDICLQIDKLPREQLIGGVGVNLAQRLLDLFDAARRTSQPDLMRKAAGLAQQLSHVIGPDPRGAAAVVPAMVNRIASALAHIERHTVGDWLELQVDGDPADGACTLVGIQLSLDTPQLAKDAGRQRARVMFEAWVDAHLRDPNGLTWKELLQVIGTVERGLGWTFDTQQWLRLQTMEARRSQDIGLLLASLTAWNAGPIDANSLHNVLELCRTAGLPDTARAELIECLLPLLPHPGADVAIHDECISAIQRVDNETTRGQLIKKHAELHPSSVPTRLPRALNGPWRKRCQDLVGALAHQWTQSPNSAPDILATVRRLSAFVDGNDANTVERQFLLLRDLLNSLDPSQRAACLADLQAACEDAIQDARMPSSGHWSTATPPVLAGLRGTLQALAVIHLGSDIPDRLDEALLTEWMVALHVESFQPEQASLLFRRIRFAYRTNVPSTVADQNAPPLSPLLRELFALHGLPE